MSQAQPEGFDNTFRQYADMTEDKKADVVEVKDAALVLKRVLDRFGPSREISLAITRLEESVMWAIKGITS